MEGVVIDNEVLQVMGLENENQLIQAKTHYEGMSVKDIINYKKRYKQQQIQIQKGKYCNKKEEKTECYTCGDFDLSFFPFFIFV
jgi:hypothetical protein